MICIGGDSRDKSRTNVGCNERDFKKQKKKDKSQPS